MFLDRNAGQSGPTPAASPMNTSTLPTGAYTLLYLVIHRTDLVQRYTAAAAAAIHNNGYVVLPEKNRARVLEWRKSNHRHHHRQSRADHKSRRKTREKQNLKQTKLCTGDCCGNSRFVFTSRAQAPASPSSYPNLLVKPHRVPLAKARTYHGI